MSYADALGIVIETGAEGPVLRMPFAPDLLGRPDFLHGGAIAGLLELAAAAALRETGAERATTLTVSVDYLRGGRPVETRAAAQVVKLGRRVANLAVEAWQEDRTRPIATARVTVRVGVDRSSL